MTKLIDNVSGNWKAIPNWEDYEINEYGAIFSLRRRKLLKIWSKKGKYPRITLSMNGQEKSFTIHRLVAMSFIPNPENKLTVNHIDGNKQNCHRDNLEWATYSENQKHAIRTGLASVPVLPNGETHPAAKLSQVDIAMIKTLLTNPDFTQAQIAKRFNVHEVHISAIKLGKTWKHLPINL